MFSNLKSGFLGERNKFRGSSVPSAAHVGFSRKTTECKESRIGKQPVDVPSNVTIKLEGQDIAVKGPLGELALSYPREVLVEREESGALRVKKAVETRRANQMHGLFRYFILLTLFYQLFLSQYHVIPLNLYALVKIILLTHLKDIGKNIYSLLETTDVANATGIMIDVNL